MSKIDDFERKLIDEGMEEQDFAEYEKLLKRVRDNFQKRQHCYTTAIQFSPRHADQAIRLIQYGLDNFEDDWFSTYTSYLYMGKIYEKAGKYKSAFESYLLARDVLGEEQSGYIKDLSGDLLWMKLHVDGFSYSRELEDYYLCYESSDEFSKSFINSRLRLAIAGAVVARHYGRGEDAKKLIGEALKVCSPGYVGDIHSILARHNYQEKINITPEAKAFLESVEL